MIDLYERTKTEPSKRALLELSLALNSYKDDMVLAGGWAPFFLTKTYFDHCGSQDIDFVLRPSVIQRYESIKDIVEGLDYTPTENPFRFKRTITDLEGDPFDILLDFLTEPTAVSDIELVNVQADLRACLIRGCSIVFPFNTFQEISGTLLDNSEAAGKIRIADIVGMMVMKGLALLRLKDKDSYDIYALAGFYDGSPDAAAEAFKSLLSKNSIVTMPASIEEALYNIRNAFSSATKFGSVAASRFIGADIAVDVSARVNRFMNAIKWNSETKDS